MNDSPISLGGLLRESCFKYADKAALLIPGPNGYETMTYRQLEQRVRQYAGALKHLGVVRGDRLCLQSENCAEWAFTDWACQSMGITLVPIYPTLPADQAQYIVRDSGAKMVVSGGPEQAEKMAGVEGVKVVLLKGSGESLASLASVHELSVEDWNRSIDSIGADDLATIIYTSGTTGNPKGAMLPHRSPTSILKNIHDSLPIDYTDTFFSFLPLSHVFERVAGHWLPISCGATIGYAKNLMTLANDIQAVKPTIILAVPRFLEAMQDRILDGVSKAPAIRQKLFHACLTQGTTKAKGGFAPLHGLLDKIVGTKIRERLGGRLRFFVSGGAALAPHTAEFYSAFGILILQGYGLTETAAASSINLPDDSKYWTVGKPIKGVEFKLAEDGEILIRGESVMSGYYNLPEETAKAIDGEGWFHTGDIGAWEGEFLKITDRKKDILVLANGKNVAPQPIENKLKESTFISEAVLFGDGNEFIYALVIPNFEHLRKHVESLGMNPPDNDQLITLDPIKQLMKAEIDKVNKSLADFEKVKRYTLLDAIFTVESGELTPSMKVRRKVVKEKYADQLKSLVG